MKFKFKFESLLKVKIQLEDQKKAEYGKALQILEELKNVKIEKEKERKMNMENANKRSSGSLSVKEMVEFQNYTTFLNNKIKEIQKSINEEEKNVDIKREELVVAVKERKTIEKLKEKAFEEHKKELLKEEQSKVDEINSYKYSK
ncbi:MAG: flagellar export protein FliJ [Clostridia bacterium]|jgi:flagellar FliJ protein|nr:flagellar export protein FliJ [Clostridia bacterium]